MPSVTVNNVKLNYIEQGAGNEVIIFIHGFSGSLGEWQKVLELLPEEYHAYALDLRGHGQSEKPGSYQLTDFVKDIYAFHQELGIGRFTYAGHSLGGKIGYKFALDHPDVLKAMFLVAPSPAHDFIPSDQLDVMKDQFMTFFGSAEAAQGFLAQQFTILPDEEILNDLVNDVMATDPAAKDECCDWWLSTNLEPQLGDIRVPMLIAAAANDSLPLDWQRRYASKINGCRFEVFENNGHFIPQESPQELVTMLLSFVSDTSKQ